jgi:DNA mismatch endonuclease, patch repair protein
MKALVKALVKPSEQRSRIMRAIKSSGTGPERTLRALARGTRCRANVRGLPGSPDLAHRGARVAIFAHGCFWHQHSCKPRKLPKTNRPFWRDKFRRNVERDRRAVRTLRGMGWRVVVLWECELAKRPDASRRRIASAFEARP